jgi:hypothetical protein
MYTACCRKRKFILAVITTLLVINLGEAEEKRFQLFEPERQVLETPGANLRFIKKCCRQAKMNLSNNPYTTAINNTPLLKPLQGRIFKWFLDTGGGWPAT